MKELENFSQEVLIILQKHNQLVPLIKSILKSKDIDSTIINEDYNNFLIKDFCTKKNINSEEELSKWLKKNKCSKKELIDQITLPIKIIHNAKDKCSNQINSYFLKKKHELDKFIYSLIRVSNKHKAEEIFFRIQDEEESFSDLAYKYSEGFEKDTNGLIGPTSIINAHPKIAEILKSSTEGELHPPICVDDWFIIIRLESFQPAILDQLMEQKMAIEIYEESLENAAIAIKENIFKNKVSSIS